MNKILAVGTHATDDPTLASFPFITAVGAVDGDKEVAIALLGEAAYLLKGAVANGIHGVAAPPLSELIKKVVGANVPVYV